MAQLVRVQAVTLAGVPAQVGDGRQLGRRVSVLRAETDKAIVLAVAASDDLGTMAPVADRRTKLGHLMRRYSPAADQPSAALSDAAQAVVRAHRHRVDRPCL